MPRLLALDPVLACPGGIVTLHGEDLLPDAALPQVLVGGAAAPVVSASRRRLRFRVPSPDLAGAQQVSVSSVPSASLLLHVGELLVTGIHQVDSPVFGADGSLYVTFSGTRGEQVPVSIFRVSPSGAREAFSSGVPNPTSMVLGPDGRLYVSSRFEGTVYRLDEDGTASPYVTEVGVPCGLAFEPDGHLVVGDRSGTLFRVGADGRTETIVTLPPSVAAYHLASGPDGWIYVSVPTLTSCDHVYRVQRDGSLETVHAGFGRPQGLAFDRQGVLHVVEALAGASGVYRLAEGQPPALLVSGESLIGVAFDPSGGLAVASQDSIYRFGPSAA